ncbi:27503_t:CDS:2, partial [Racocetra persica]
MAPSHKFLTDLSDDMAELLNTGAGYDVVIQVGEEPNVKEFRTHSVMLAARRPYFQTALSSKWAKKQGDIFVFRKPNISPRIFKEILQYLYTGTIDLAQQDGTDLIKILVAADELGLQKIVEIIKQYLIDNQSELLIRNPIRFVQSVFLYDICASLRDYCLQAICENPHIIFGSSDYLSLDKSLLLRLLKCEQLEMEEIDIWLNLLKWGIAQNSLAIKLDERNPAKNLLQWTDKDFIALRESLNDLIPLIRWIHISSGDFLHKVRPFKKLLPQTLYEEVLSYHLDSGSKPSSIEISPRKGPIFDSVLMDNQHVCALASWIDNESGYYDRTTNPYNFKLLLRATRDGFDPTTFHNLCDNKGATIMVSKLSSTRQLIGGYNPLYWSPLPEISENSSIASASSPNNNSTSGGSWWKTSSGFLFSFNDLDFKIARVQRPQYAVYYDRKYGPGWGYSGDLIIKDSGSIYNSQKSMTYPEASKFFPYTTSSEYDIDEYEVFQVIRKPGFREIAGARYYSRGIIRALKRQNWNYFFKVLIM